MINNTAMKEKENIPPWKNKGTNEKRNAPDTKDVKEQDNRKLQDKKQQDDIFRMADTLKGCLTIVVAVIIAYFCYSLCANGQKHTTKPKTEIAKPQN